MAVCVAIIGKDLRSVLHSFSPICSESHLNLNDSEQVEQKKRITERGFCYRTRRQDISVTANQKSLCQIAEKFKNLKCNAPKFFTCLNPDEELNFQYKVLSALDNVEEKLNSGLKGGSDSRELYLGMLYSLETHKIFGYVTNTKIKIIIIVDSTNMALRDNEIRSMFRKIHSEYSDVVCNPFYIPGEPITSKSFANSIKNIMIGNI